MEHSKVKSIASLVALVAGFVSFWLFYFSLQITTPKKVEEIAPGVTRDLGDSGMFGIPFTDMAIVTARREDLIPLAIGLLILAFGIELALRGFELYKSSRPDS